MRRGTRNIDIWGMETHKSVSEASRAWNQKTQTWLERYTYNRTGGSLLATYFVSAFWHGFYPGYYIFFIGFAIGTMAQRKLKAFLPRICVRGCGEAHNGVECVISHRWDDVRQLPGVRLRNAGYRSNRRLLLCVPFHSFCGRVCDPVFGSEASPRWSKDKGQKDEGAIIILLLVPKPCRGGQKTQDNKKPQNNYLVLYWS